MADEDYESIMVEINNETTYPMNLVTESSSGSEVVYVQNPPESIDARGYGYAKIRGRNYGGGWIDGPILTGTTGALKYEINDGTAKPTFTFEWDIPASGTNS